APIMGIGFLVLFRMATTGVDFDVTGANSNSDSSGGYGPNQVSAILSLGALMALFGFLGVKRSRVLQVWFGAVMVWLLAQATLTFSRTGVYLFGSSVALALVFWVQWKGGKGRVTILAAILG